MRARLSRIAHGRAGLALAIVLLVAVPLVPGVFEGGSPAGLIRLPIESIIAVLVLSLVPWRPARIGIAIVYGVVVVAALLLAAIDAAFQYALDVPFDLSDWQQVGDGFGVVEDSIGSPIAIAIVVLLVIIAAATVAVLGWAVLRVDESLRRHLVRGTMVASTVAGVWVVTVLAGSQLVAGQPVAASASVGAIRSAAAGASATLRAEAALSHQIRSDRYRDVPASGLLTALRGKDVVFAFIESYGQVAVQGTAFSDGVVGVLRAGQTQLAAEGYASQSAWMTSPTFGGVSWLAHSTLQSGLWIDKQPVYNKLVRSDRFTLSDAFAKAGWKTVSDVPSDPQPWAFGTSFYHYGTLLDTNNVGYHGPSFGYARIPDQYTWKYFFDHQLAGPHQPVMAEIDLVSSHTPWAPLPRLVPWSQIGDGSVYVSQPAEGQSTSAVWQDPKRVQTAYGQSVQYALGAMFSFLHANTDPNLVLVVLGDHQPATVVSGKNANHEVPISIISRDPGVFQAISGWQWQDGVIPGAGAPLWRMDSFRNRFLSAFD